MRYLGPTFGGINLEDIKAPECFIIEQRLRELMDIPVFHDDQHGTAIVSAAGLINALHLTGRNIKDIKMVVNGAGAASIACIELVKAMGMPHENAILCDTKGVIYQGRTEGMNQWKSAHAVRTKARTLEEAMKGADVFFGLSVKGAVTKAMVKSMADKPIIFAMANPDPEITPEDVRSVRSDAIVATGRSDYPNQVNNVLGFPYIFRGALDVRARTINEEMKVAAAEALAELAREDVPDEVDRAYSGRRLRYGPGIYHPGAVRSAPDLGGLVGGGAGGDGFRRRAQDDRRHGRLPPRARRPARPDQPLAAEPVRPGEGQSAAHGVRRGRGGAHHPRRRGFRDNGYGTPILIGREEQVRETMKRLGIGDTDGLEIHNARLSRATSPTPTSSTSACSATATCSATCSAWSTRAATSSPPAWWRWATPTAWSPASPAASPMLQDIKRVIDPGPDKVPMGYSIVVARHGTVFIADTTVNETPTPEQLADIAKQMAAQRPHHGPRAARRLPLLLQFRQPRDRAHRPHPQGDRLLDAEKVDFEYDGEMQADMALDYELLQRPIPSAASPARPTCW